MPFVAAIPAIATICSADSPHYMTSRATHSDSVLPDEDLELLAGIADFNLTVR